jgi:predicted Zn-dependent peptidase
MVGLDELTGLGYDYFKTVDDKYQAVTLDDIKRVANQYFNGTPHAVVIETPSEEKE